MDSSMRNRLDDFDATQPTFSDALICTSSCGSHPPSAVRMPMVTSWRCGGVRPGRE